MSGLAIVDRKKLRDYVIQALAAFPEVAGDTCPALPRGNAVRTAILTWR